MSTPSTLAQKEPYFFERQYFKQWWLWLFLAAMVALPLYGIYVQLIEKRPWGNNPMPDLGLILFALAMFGFAYFFRYMRLDTSCDHSGIGIWFRPFLTKKVAWQDIADAQVVNYGFVGYGIRLGSKYGTVYNIAGRLGLAITTKSGSRFVIGTQRPDELLQTVNSYLNP